MVFRSDVFEINLVFVEVRDSQGIRLVKSDSRGCHWARQPGLSRRQHL